MNVMKSTITVSLALALGCAPAYSQGTGFTFGVDWRGPVIGQQVSGAVQQVNEADILTFGPGAPGLGPLQAPSYAISADQLGLNRYALCVNHPPFFACGIEVDAISQGMDALISDTAALAGPLIPSGKVWFSVDEFAVGSPAGGLAPSVASEGGSIADGSADVFIVYGLGVGPVGPAGALAWIVGVFDGNGFPSAAPSGALYPGIGLTEPNLPFAIPSTGDNLDSLDVGGLLGFPATGIYITLDAAFVDPLSGIANAGSAIAQGVFAADILLVSVPAVSPTVFAAGPSLGLDLVGGPGSDDLDAMSIAENGNGTFDASSIPYDWVTGATDMVLFSVRRGSAVIGAPDSIFGAPIEPGDILTTPLPTAMGGLSPFPGIMFSAESLGLATTRTDQVAFGDDMDALDFESKPCFDCNNNGIEDAVDISTGASTDVNGDGVPDECEKVSEYCFCPSGSTCNNPNSTAGCANSHSAGAHLYFMGTTSVTADDLELVTDGVPPNKFGLYYMGGGTLSLPIGDGIRCVGSGGVGTFRYGVLNSGAGGVLSSGPGVAGDSCTQFNPPGCIVAGDTWYLQGWYRDPAGPCGGGFNFSNGIKVEFVP
jgi:hypothetical protein